MVPSELDGKKVTKIGGYAFSGCIGLTSVEIPSSVTSIGYFAFRDCIGLTSVEIPSSVKWIGSGAFGGCSSLESLKVSEGNVEYDSRENCNVIIETVSNTLVVGCKNTKIPSSVKWIGESAFSGCSSLTSVAIPPSMTGIGYGTFSDCSENLIIIGVPGSEAEKYAQSHGIAFNPVEDISKAAITLEKDSYIYDGKPKTPAVSVELGGKTLAPNTDYTVSYQDNINAGTAKVAVEGKGNYIGSAQKEFTIKKADTPAKGDISEASITLERVSYTYDGKPKGPAVTVKLGGKTLAPNTDYTVSYSDNINVGTAKAAVTGKGGYTGSKSAAFAIVEATGTGQPAPAITCKKTLYKVTYGAKPFKVKATSASRLSFTSNKPKVAAVAKDTGEVTVKGTGVAEITVKAGKESVKVTVQVSPRRPSLKSAKAAKGRKLTVKWVKDRMAAGYQVQVSTSKAFKKDVKSKKLAKASHTFTKLKAGKKYYVRVRSYKGALRSAWSKVRQSGKIKR